MGHNDLRNTAKSGRCSGAGAAMMDDDGHISKKVQMGIFADEKDIFTIVKTSGFIPKPINDNSLTG